MEQQNNSLSNNTSNTPNKPIVKQNPYLIPAAIVIAGTLIALAIIITQRPTSPLGTGNQIPPPQNQIVSGDISIDFENWPSMGDPSAPVVIVEYSDFACPFCKQLHDQVLSQIKQQYIDTGKVRFVYKDFVVVGGDRAAEAAHCAGEQNAFWQYHDLLFERQTADRGNWSNPTVHRQYAQELGLNANALVECFESRRHQEKVSTSTQEAYANGGQGTPFTLVNNIPVSGAQPFSAFQQIIEAELAK